MYALPSLCRREDAGLWVWCDYCCEKMAQTRKKHRYYGINTRLSKAEEWPFAYYRVRDKRGVPCKSHWEQFRSKHNSMGMVCPGASQRANYKPNTRHKLCPDHNTENLQFFYGLLQTCSAPYASSALCKV